MNKDTTTNSIQDVRVQLALDNWDDYVKTLTTLSDKQLSKKLDLIHIQSQLALKNNNVSSTQLLEIWWKQTVEARILKAENNIADAPNEIELAIADIETVVAKAEDRQEIIESIQTHQKVYKPKIKEDNGDQISLF
jgi:peptidoglycan hydrolase CwlO-like protein